MSDDQRLEANSLSHLSGKAGGETVVVRVPKPNLQVVVLALIALITLFQTYELVRIGSKASSAAVKTAAPAITTNSGSGTGSGSDAPQSMVGGC